MTQLILWRWWAVLLLFERPSLFFECCKSNRPPTMTSPSTCVPQMSHRHHMREELSEGHRNPSSNSLFVPSDHIEEDPLLLLHPDPDNGNIQDDYEENDEMNVPQMARHVPTLVVNEPTPYSPYIIEKMRRRLRFFFMDPIEKWQARKQFPLKLLLQIFKIVIVTVQLGLFGTTRYSHMNFYEDNKMALCNLFLKDWDPQREVEAYPPNQGPYAVYTKTQFYEHVDHIANTYATIRETAIGSYDYVHSNLSQSPITICKTYYKKAVIFGFNESFIFDSNPEQKCLEVVPEVPMNSTTPPSFNSRTLFAENNFSIVFERLINVEVKFILRYIHLKALDPLDSPDCYQFNVRVMFDDQDHDGQARVFLEMIPQLLDCREGLHLGDKYKLEVALLNVLNSLVILICLLSLLLCSRAIIRAQVLKYETITFFAKHYGKKLTVNDRLEFLNVWYVMIIINDVLIILGSAVKIQIENKIADVDLYNVCSILLGSGSLLVWIGVLRYFGFFPKYNILILTMRRAVPDVLRFLLCAMLMYFGFIFCGWLVLGPYHIKFRSLSSTAECLFSLINGDDMFATFTIISVKSGLIWWYSRIYMYSFIALFIYVVLSLFIAVIMDTYETIKNCYEHGFPKSDLMEFVSECRDDISSGIFRLDSVDSWGGFKQLFLSCFQRGNSSERQPLLGAK